MDIYEIIKLFTDEVPQNIKEIDTSHNETDFRKVFIADFGDGEDKKVFKVSCNGFTTPERITGWQKSIETYRSLGCYCPLIYGGRSGNFPEVEFEGHRCVAYAEEFSKYPTVEDVFGTIKYPPERSEGMSDDRYTELSDEVARNNERYSKRIPEISKDGYYTYLPHLYRISALLAGMKLDFTPFPSGYASFEKFDPNDADEEVRECADTWHKMALGLPEQFRERVDIIWDRWEKNRDRLRKQYHLLPTTVFQADTNPTNVLIDENNEFKGLMDFNLCGRDSLLNYIMRETPYTATTRDFCEEGLKDYYADTIKQAFGYIKPYYKFGADEIRLAPMLFRYLRPLFYEAQEDLEDAGRDTDKIEKALAKVEYLQTVDYDFEDAMK